MENIRPYLELLYFTAGILLLGGVWLAYRQLLLIATDIKVKNERAAAEKAVETCRLFLADYLDKNREVFKQRLGAKAPQYKGPIGDFSLKSLPKEAREGLNKRHVDSWLPAANLLEAIAATFISGVADECIAFKVIGRTFCSVVKQEYDLISMCRDGQEVAYWGNTVQLYNLWHARLTKTEMSAARRDLEQKIDSIADAAIAPLGAMQAK